MKRVLFSISLILCLLGCSKKTSEEPLKVVTTDVTQVTMISAVLSGFVDINNLSEGTFGFIISTSPDFTGEMVIESYAVVRGREQFSARATGLSFSTTYYYKAFYVKWGGAYYEGETKQFTTRDFELVAVDMGLTVKWASANLGATSENGYGDYFAWGETEPYYEPGDIESPQSVVWKEGKTGYNWESYKWYGGSWGVFTKYNSKDNKTALDPEDDAAAIILGGRWRMPTNEEWNELNNNCSWEWVSINGIKGSLATSKINGNCLFLPALGWWSDDGTTNRYTDGLYWSSSIDQNYYSSSTRAWFECFKGNIEDWDRRINTPYTNTDYWQGIRHNRYNGLPIRPVSD